MLFKVKWDFREEDIGFSGRQIITQDISSSKKT